MIELDPATMADLKGTTTATVCARLFRRGFRNVLIHNVKGLRAYSEPLVGPAYTLRFIAAREDLDGFGAQPDPNEIQREAFETAPNDSVLIMECRGETRAACCGDLLVGRFMVRGGAGIVSDGGIRDSAQVRAMALPVFAAASSPPVNRVVHHALEHGRPITCGGVAVYPGDVAFGDADGVVIIPRHLVGEIAEEAVAQEQQESWLAKRILSGAPLKGNFPASAATLEEYQQWRAAQDEQ